MPTIQPETLIIVALVIFVGYTIFGATGFGASPITIPVLAHVLPLPFVLSLAALLDLSSGLALGFHTRKQAEMRELATLIPFTLVGLALGVTLLVRLPRNATVLALGLFVCVYALHVWTPRGSTTEPALGCARRHSGRHHRSPLRHGRPALRRVHHRPNPGPGGPARPSPRW